METQVSAVLAQMQVLGLAVEDEPGPASLRGFVERNSIALLSAYRFPAIDPASPDWLGHFCPRDRVRKSGLWNSNHVDESVDPAFLDVFEELIESGVRSRVITRNQREAPIAKSPVRVGGSADLIIAALQRRPDLDDDELAQVTGVTPRQRVNIICRRLEQRGFLKRLIGSRGKIVNRLTDTQRAERVPAVAQAPRPLIQPAAKAMAFSTSTSSTICLDESTDDTLVIIPCSGGKSKGSEPVREGDTLLGELPDVLACRLASARRAVAEIAHLDESTLMPAWRRYTGTLYRSARSGLEQAQETPWFWRLLILAYSTRIVTSGTQIAYASGMPSHR